MSDEVELTHAQTLFWAGQQLDPKTPFYNMAVSIAIHGELDPVRFERALRAVIGSSDALMTIFDEVRGLPRGRVNKSHSWRMERVDFCLEDDPQRAAEEWAGRRCRRIFALNQFLFDTALIKVDEERYIWYLNQHHLVTDAWSTAVLFKRVSQAYVDGDFSIHLPKFSDYAAFELGSRKSKGNLEIKDFWTAKTRNRSAAPRLYGHRGSGGSTESERIRICLGTFRSNRIRAIAMEEEIRCLTPHLTLFNLFSMLLFGYLYRISGQRDLTVSAPAHNRPTLQFKETIGLFIELFPLIADIEEGETFQSLYEKLKVESADFLRNARPGCSHSDYNRSCNVVLNYINAEFGAFAGMSTKTNWLHTGHSDRGHHLRLLVYDFDAASEFVLEFDASCQVFGKGMRSRMHEHFLSIVDAFLDDRYSLIDVIELRSREERMLQRELGSGSFLRLDERETLASSILRQVENFPDRTAVVESAGSVTFAELERGSRRIAEELERSGIESGSVVPVVAAAGTPLLTAMLGILRHGSTYIPVDPLTPVERFRRVLSDSGASLILVSGQSELLSVFDVREVSIDGHLESEKEPALPIDFDRSTSEAIAYVLYTSGSTGQPKGVSVSHRAVLNLINYTQNRVPIEGKASCAIWTNVGFDVSVYEIFTALGFGHTLHVPDPVLRIDGEKLFGYWRENRIASGYLPPFLLPLLDQWLDDNEWNARRILVGVESIPHELLASIARKSPGLKIINGYGPTEATVCATYSIIDSNTLARKGAAPIGRPLANVACHVLDHQQKPVPLGAVGELWISGDGLGAGYFNDSEMTAHRFRELNIEGRNHRSYRTGDAVRFLENGELEYLGRLDQQLKIRGIRIEPVEIQSAVLSDLRIRECVVRPVREGADLAAYIIATEDVDPFRLRQKMRAQLPDAVIPGHFIQVEHFPRTASGKIDLAALPEPESDCDRVSVSPDGPVEEVIFNIYSELLGNNEISVDQSFMQLGGDSLFAMRAIVRIREEFELDLPLHTVFQAPSIREMGELVTQTLTAEIEALDDDEAERLAADT